MSTYQISPDVFFLAQQGKMIVWDFISHRQYSLNRDYLHVLLEILETGQSDHQLIVNELSAASLIQPFTHRATQWEWSLISKIFHFGTRNLPYVELSDDPKVFLQEYINCCNNLDVTEKIQKQIATNPLITLPTPNSEHLDKKKFSEILMERRTCRDFKRSSVSLAEFSSLLFYSFGNCRSDWPEIKQAQLSTNALHKSYPCSGGIHAANFYLIIYAVEELVEGIYQYHDQSHQLEFVTGGDMEEQVTKLNRKQFYSKGLSFGVYISIEFDQYWKKYKHSKNYKSIYTDIGHISQNFLLCATALGLVTWLTGEFEEQQIEALLKINKANEYVLFFLGAGKGSGKAIPTFE